MLNRPREEPCPRSAAHVVCWSVGERGQRSVAVRRFHPGHDGHHRTVPGPAEGVPGASGRALRSCIGSCARGAQGARPERERGEGGGRAAVLQERTASAGRAAAAPGAAACRDARGLLEAGAPARAASCCFIVSVRLTLGVGWSYECDHGGKQHRGVCETRRDHTGQGVWLLLTSELCADSGSGARHCHGGAQK